MKKQKIRYAIVYCILTLIWGILITLLFMGCNIYEKETVEIIRCPVIEADTIEIPNWKPIEESGKSGSNFINCCRMVYGCPLTGVRG